MLVDHVSENSVFVTKTSLFEIEAKVSSRISNYQPFLCFTSQCDTESLGEKFKRRL